MKKSTQLAAAALTLFAGAASAQSDNPWAGFYAGPNLGGAWNSTCNSSTLAGASIDTAAASTFYNRNCANGGSFVAGVQIGDNFQYKRLVVGFGADLDIRSAKSQNLSLIYAGTAPPAGTYAYSSRLGPSDFAILGPLIGYAGDQWMPYLRGGAIITDGSRDTAVFYTPAGGAKYTTSFGGKSYSSTGWVAGGGAQYGLNGAWSITAEYLHANFGKGSDSSAGCAGIASACAAFSGISLDSTRLSSTADIFRVGINYWFAYWGT
jgi:opacity protein-like surface antigen